MEKQIIAIEYAGESPMKYSLIEKEDLNQNLSNPNLIMDENGDLRIKGIFVDIIYKEFGINATEKHLRFFDWLMTRFPWLSMKYLETFTIPLGNRYINGKYLFEI